MLKTADWRGLLIVVALTGLLAVAGCNGGTDNVIVNRTLTLAFTGLENLGDDYVYEGWLLVNGAPVSTGRFSVDASGTATPSAFTVGAADAASANKFILTIEPATGDVPAPADTHILAGNIANGMANLTVDDDAALGTDFSGSAAPFILNTPSTGADDTDFNQGIWWLDPAGAPDATIDLPTLPAGWQYEGWVVVGGTPYTTGTFTMAAGADSDGAGLTGGPDAVPAFPGQDYITTPLDLHGGTAVISVEPNPDNAATPFTLKPLVGDIPAALAIGTLSPMNDNSAATNPTGTATIN